MSWLRDRSRAHVEAALAKLISPLDARLRKDAIRVVAESVVLDQRQDFDSPELLVSALARVGDRCIAEIDRLETESSALLLEYQRALDEKERREILRRHLTAIGPSSIEARRDISAVNRWLDIEALRERYATRVSERIDEVVVCYDAIAALIRDEPSGYRLVRSLHHSGTIVGILEHASPKGRTPVRRSALRAVASALRRLEPSQRAMVLGVSGVRLLADYARGIDTTRWVQRAALECVSCYLPETALVRLLGELMNQLKAEDAMVIRAGAVRQIAELESPSAIVRLALRDPSEHVRQTLARTLVGLRHRRANAYLSHLALKDPSPRVRGVALFALTDRAIANTQALTWAVAVLRRSLEDDNPALVMRTALVAVQRLCRVRADVDPVSFADALLALAHGNKASPELVEQATFALRALALDEKGRALAQRLRETLETLDEGERARVEFPEPEREVVEALRVAARDGHAVALRPLGNGRYLVTRGEPRRLRLWRLWHELRNPMPDKRKGYVHSHARAPLGPYVLPPVGMAEVTPTRVPGERVLHGRVGGWGSFLPRIDDLLTAALSRRPLRLVTSLGTVVVEGPVGIRARSKAYLWLCHNYARASLIRESSLEATEPRGQQSYLGLMHDLGFRLNWDARDGNIVLRQRRHSIRPSILVRYLGELGTLITIPPDLLQQFFVHALSPTANTPSQLAAVIWVIFAGYLLRATVIMHKIVRARRALPLSIGGWGTRGKSGSERLKAALFHALRYDVVVKTTGCEAMFIHAQRDQPAQEIFIYRPYDKATIWEQRNMLEVAQRLKTQVFLWECMALQPRFVEELIDEWMKDPITTLTNAYPDHEDIQGPSGEDVARVIARFMPVNGTTFTTEEQMLPLLCDGARRKNTKLIKVEPLDADLLPVDLLNRLPYQEHPRNVALVLALAEHLEVDREYALVEIADYVVLDLGVLKTYPEARHRGRRLVFSNGMSANERAGFMSNWVRLGFDQHDVDEHADTYTVAVVNNRADRVARSRVFAQIMVDDASLSSIVLINGNLGGLLTFITEALDKKLTTLSLLGDGPSERIFERLDEHLRWLKVPIAPESNRRLLERMLPTLGLKESEICTIVTSAALARALEESDAGALSASLEATLPKADSEALAALRADVLLHAERQATRIARAQLCRRAIAEAISANRTGEVDEIFRAAYRELFLDRITILWNSGATGDQVIDFLTHSVPPGHLARVLGCQNIKGTGLDFVYRWLSIDRVCLALQKLETTPSARQELLAWLGSYNDFGLLDARHALTTLQEFQRRKEPGWGPLDHLLGGVVSRLSQLVQEKEAKLHAVGKADPFSKMAGIVEAAVDHLDSARRSRHAHLVMQDLFAARVGHGKAALLLRDVTGRQKGGWLAKDLKRWLARRRERSNRI